MVRHFVYIFIMSILIWGCSKNSTNSDSLTPAQISGEYNTTKFQYQSPDNTLDLLTLGAFVKLNLKSDKTTEGRLFVPDTLGVTENGPVDLDLDGTYRISDNMVSFQHNSDTFIRDAEWSWGNGRLSTKATFGDETIQVELARK